MSKENFVLYQWNNETKEFWFLGEKIDYIHNPREWRKHLNNLVDENKKLKERIEKAQDLIRNETSLNDSEIDELSMILDGDYDD